LEKLKAILNIGSSAEIDRLALTEGEEGEDFDTGRACAFDRDRVGVGLVKECRGRIVGLQKDGERLWSAILRE